MNFDPNGLSSEDLAEYVSRQKRANKVSAWEFFETLRTTNNVFSCVTFRKNDKKVDGEVVAKAGEEISSTYRFKVPATKKEAGYRLTPGVRESEDFANGVITAYDMTKFDNDGNRGAFRRINVRGVQRIKAYGKEYRPYEHDGILYIIEA